MQRRHFIKLTGTGIGALVISGWNGDEKKITERVSLPQKVSVKLDDGVHEMASRDKATWTYKDVIISLKYDDNDALQAFLQSPSSALYEVQLMWHYDTTSKTKLCGNHWERTYGDGAFEAADANRKMPWYFVQSNNENTVCFGVKTGCRSFCYWTVGNGAMQLVLDARTGGKGVQLRSRTLHAANIITTKNKTNENTFYTARRFCSLMCSAPRLPKQPVYGINDWYFAYGNNSADLILQHTSLIAPLVTNTSNKPFSVIDMGWAVGTDHTKSNEKFGDMQQLADKIKALGMRPGIWTRPLWATGKENKNLLAPNFKNNNKEDGQTLDPTIEENIEHIKHMIGLYKQWGFDMVKHDYTTFDIFSKWGFEMNDAMTEPGWQFNDTAKTNAEIILHLYSSIREAAADMYLIGCNTISHLSAGVFELNRIGDDTSGREWARTKKMGVNTMAFRLMQHDTFYAADGDCVGLTTAIPWDKNKQWMQLLAQSGAPLFLSAQPDALGAEQKETIKQSFALAAQKLPVGEPLDWLSNPFPNKWKLNGEVKNFEW